MIRRVRLTGGLIFIGFISGCANDHSHPPFHTDIRYNPAQSHTYLSEVPPTNAPSTRDWKTNQVVGVGYGTANPEGIVPNSTGAASTPSGTSSGAATGVTSGGAGVSTAPGIGLSPGTAAPGAITANPASTGTIGTAPTPAPQTGTINPGTSLGTQSPGPGVNSGLGNPLNTTRPASPTFNSLGITNTVPGTTFTNIIPAQTNLVPGLGRP